MTTLLIVIHVLVSLFLIVIVLLQHGKGADIGATFGGSSQSLFGSEGPVPLLNKITTASAVIFMLTSVTLAYMSAHRSTSSVMSDLKAPQSVDKKAAAKPLDTSPIKVPLPGEKEKEAKVSADQAAPAGQTDTSSQSKEN